MRYYHVSSTMQLPLLQRQDSIHMKISGLLCIFLLWCGTAQASQTTGFAVATVLTPVFNSPAAAAGNFQPPDHCGQNRQLEFIALPGTVFTIVDGEPPRHTVLQVTTTAYQPPADTRLYLAADLVSSTVTRPAEPSLILPEPEQILQRLRSAAGTPYIWGGNRREGIILDGNQIFAGLDCSGLLYEATNGVTPRNTADLLGFGWAVPIEGLGIDDLTKRLQPLDLIVWQGHLVIVLDQQTVIESVLRCQGGFSGVVISPLHQRLQQLLRRRVPADSWPEDVPNPQRFVVRRWR